MDGYDLRSRRRTSGLSLAAVARSAGTAESNVSAYERGTKRPSNVTITRLDAAIKAGSASPIHVYRLVTVPAAAAAIRAGLRAGWAVSDLLRVVREMRSNSKFVRTDADRSAFYAPPSTTGDRRWDALLAGVAEMDNLRSGGRAPEWVLGHELAHLWFVGSNPKLHPYAMTQTPPSLLCRGVIIDGASLESV